MKLLDGKQISQTIYEDLEVEIQDLYQKYKIVPGLAIVLVGNNPDSVIYVNMKKKACKRLGINSFIIKLGENIPEEILLDKIQNLNNDQNIHGMIVQLPLPKHLNEFKILSQVEISKDVDGFHQTNMYKLFLNQSPLFSPCTPEGCIYLLEKADIEISGKNIVIIGTSRIVGLPLSLMLMHKEATVTMCHIKTKNIKEHTKNADILIVACGQPEMVKKDWVKKGVIIIDIGINKLSDKIVGDVDHKDVRDKVDAITPVPGGVGPMTVAILMKHAVQACLLSIKNENILRK